MGRQAEKPGSLRGSWGLAAILSSSFLLIQAQEISIKVEPPKLFEGQNATLIPGGKDTYQQCIWYRLRSAERNRIFTYVPLPTPAEQRNGPSFTGRETGGPKCSMHITGLTLYDTDDYYVTKILDDGIELGQVSIQVFAAPPSSGVIAPGIAIGTVAGIVLIEVLF